jgi:hypothetical protein
VGHDSLSLTCRPGFGIGPGDDLNAVPGRTPGLLVSGIGHDLRRGSPDQTVGVLPRTSQEPVAGAHGTQGRVEVGGGQWGVVIAPVAVRPQEPVDRQTAVRQRAADASPQGLFNRVLGRVALPVDELSQDATNPLVGFASPKTSEFLALFEVVLSSRSARTESGATERWLACDQVFRCS